MVKTVYEANVFGLVRVTHAMLPLLRESNSPVIVNVSSGTGSFGLVTDPAHPGFALSAVAYGSSKAAVSALTVQCAKALPEIRINAVDPGYTATDLRWEFRHPDGPGRHRRHCSAGHDRCERANRNLLQPEPSPIAMARCPGRFCRRREVLVDGTSVWCRNG